MIYTNFFPSRLHWPRTAKRINNWRKKTAQKLREYLKEVHPDIYNPDKMEPEIAMLLDGKSQQEAREATRKKQERRKQADLEREEARFTFEVPFVGSEKFLGKREGYVFKTGFRGLGYYEDVAVREYARANGKMED